MPMQSKTLPPARAAPEGAFRSIEVHPSKPIDRHHRSILPIETDAIVPTLETIHHRSTSPIDYPLPTIDHRPSIPDPSSMEPPIDLGRDRPTSPVDQEMASGTRKKGSGATQEAMTTSLHGKPRSSRSGVTTKLPERADGSTGFTTSGSPQA